MMIKLHFPYHRWHGRHPGSAGPHRARPRRCPRLLQQLGQRLVLHQQLLLDLHVLGDGVLEEGLLVHHLLLDLVDEEWVQTLLLFPRDLY